MKENIHRGAHALTGVNIKVFCVNTKVSDLKAFIYNCV